MKEREPAHIGFVVMLISLLTMIMFIALRLFFAANDPDLKWVDDFIFVSILGFAIGIYMNMRKL